MRILTHRELKAILWLVPILAVGCYIAWCISYPPISTPQQDIVQTEKADTTQQSPQDSIVLFEFDPNTVEFFDLCRLGFERNEALSIIKYRERGKVFEIAEDFASCYAVDESTYNALRPYIKIGKEFALKKFEKRADYRRDTPKQERTIERFEFMPDTASISTFMRLGFSERQAETIIKFRTTIGGFHSADEFEKCYMISEALAKELRPYALYEPEHQGLFPIELNSADSALLCKVVGIGAKSAKAILERRELLGGFYRVEQLAEIPQITESNYERILSQIWIDTCKISKININFAPAKELLTHPYFTPLHVRKLLKERQLKGGWCSQEDFLNNKILTEQEKARIAPYLIFRCKTNNQSNFN